MLLSDDRNKTYKMRQDVRCAYRAQSALARRLGKDEDGGIIVLTLLLLVCMLIVGGMGVDFMRLESERTKLQSVSDRAVLAAASLEQELVAAEVITDFFDTAGYGDNIVGTPYIEKDESSAMVRVDSSIEVPTFYLRLIGIDTLTAQAVTAAIQGTGKVEVSLVLDISGSMSDLVTEKITNDDGTSSTVKETRMWFLQRAASQFVGDLLLPEYKDRISISLINYSQHVNIGDDLYRALNTTPDSITQSGAVGSSFGTFVTDAKEPLFTNPTRCVDFLGSEFNTLTFDTDRVYQQVEYVDPGLLVVCPPREEEGIVLFSQDADLLKSRINALEPIQTTSIHLGLKWGVSLLDPSMRELIGGIPTVDPAFRGTRPGNYASGDTVKYLILMTDGVNVAAQRAKPGYYDSHYLLTRLANHGFMKTPWERFLVLSGLHAPNTAADYNRWMSQLCNLAKARYTVYTVTMGDENVHMTNCASEPSFAFRTSMSNNPNEPGMDDIFRSISDQITALRLSL